MLHLRYQEVWRTKEELGSKFCFPVDAYFERYYKNKGMYKDLYDFAKRVVSEIDSSELLSPMTVSSPVFDIIPIDWVSTGAKNLILISSDLDLTYSMDFLGNNCYPLLHEIASRKEVYVTISNLSRLVSFDNLLPIDLEGTICKTMDELIRCALLITEPDEEPDYEEDY